MSTKGALYILESSDSINSVADLRGRTVYLAGQGSNPEYILNYLLESAGLTVGQDVFVEFTSAHDEAAALFAAGIADVVMLPEPNVAAVLVKSENVRIALDITEEWDKISGGGELIMGCVVVRNEFLRDNRAAVDAFLREYEESVKYMNENIDDGAALCAQYEIIPSELIAKAAIPRSAIIYMDGADMQTAINHYFDVLFAADPSSIGGAIPDEEFYYTK